MAALKFDSVGFSYEGGDVLTKLSFELLEEELLVVLGPSGTGKTTVLRLAAGLEAPEAGTIFLLGETASVGKRVMIGPAGRRSSLVFQDLALWPHLTADEHLSFAGPTLSSGERVALLQSVDLGALATRLPANMSGGERQRLALARALASKPRLLLLDEPFANLDPELRIDLRNLLLELHRGRGVSILYVTHDLEDAFELGDRIAVLNAGKIEQVGTPEDLYLHPSSPFVANFVGRGTIVPGRVDGSQLRTPLGAVPNPRAELVTGEEVLLVIRPEALELTDDGFTGKIESVTFGGGRYLVALSSAGYRLWAYSTSRFSPGETVKIRMRDGWPIQRICRG